VVGVVGSGTKSGTTGEVSDEISDGGTVEAATTSSDSKAGLNSTFFFFLLELVAMLLVWGDDSIENFREFFLKKKFPRKISGLCCL
jgi:hypothetical protein